MIPRKLRLKNFMCYRGEAVLDFSGLTVACISGENGAGKSALLDAITWALWGKGRGGSVDDLMTTGANDMEVDFEFDLGADAFRVRRQRRRKGAAVLELQVGRLNAAGGPAVWKPITADSLALTQALLTKTIGMDYTTFINSAFVLQGRADEFTTRRPADRKQLLADILGLGRYDDLETRSRDLRRASETALRDINRDLEHIEQELSTAAGKQEELALLNDRLIASTATLDRANQELVALNARLAEQELRAKSAEAARQRAAGISADLARIEARVSRDRAALEAAASVIADGDTIRRLHQELLDAEVLEAELNARGREQRRLAAEMHALERAIEAANQDHARRLHALDQEVERLRDESERRASLQAQDLELRARLTEVELALERDAALAAERHAIEVENRERGAVMAALRTRMTELKEQQTLIVEAGAACPTCRRPLGHEEREQIRLDYETEGKQLGDRYRELKAARDRANERSLAAQAEQERLAPVVRRKAGLDRQAGQLAHQIAAAVQAGALLASRTRERDALARALEGREFAREEQQQLLSCRAALTDLGWDERAYAAVRDRVAALMPQRVRFETLTQAIASVDAIEARISEEEALRAERVNELIGEQALERELRASIVELPALMSRAAQLESAVALQAREQAELTRQHGALLALLTRLADREEEARVLRAERKRVALDETLYKELTEAFGKRGIQAMIIERAIPEVQDEANAILANMPGSTLRVEFRTQRETQKGTLIEALDVRISDEAGERDYAMYSGGESFRVNFAIRVALSKLLTRRAGAKLQTLVVDEGFGTQDERGRDGIVEAIGAIERDFATILVITHINELKDAFPRQIAIEKTATGSRISVI